MVGRANWLVGWVGWLGMLLGWAWGKVCDGPVHKFGHRALFNLKLVHCRRVNCSGDCTGGLIEELI